MTNEHDFLGEETEVMDTAAPSAEEAANEAKDTRTWTNEAGEEVSKSEFIREQFLTHNKSRKEISEEFDINYRTVYGATVNMTNDAEPASRGRAAANHKIHVTTEGDVVSTVDGKLQVNGEDAEGSQEDYATTEVDRNDWIKQQVTEGVSRGDVAKKLGLSYGVIYGITKELEGSSQRHEIEYQGKTMSRSEYIRTKFAEGMSKSEIASELGVDYPVVWSALKSLKSEEEKFQDQVARLEKFAEFVTDKEAFEGLLEQLKAVEFAEESSEEESTEEAAE